MMIVLGTSVLCQTHDFQFHSDRLCRKDLFLADVQNAQPALMIADPRTSHF